jgi:enterochelin esterase family protein
MLARFKNFGFVRLWVWRRTSSRSDRDMRSEITLTQTEFHSTTGEPRPVWIQRPLTAKPSGVCLFLDAEYYLPQIRAATIIEELQREGHFPPMLTAYVSSHADSLTRWTDSFCNDAFAEFLVAELMPWLIAEFDVSPGKNILAGLSLTGLSAVHTGLEYPEVFPRVLSLSGSFWWDSTWLPQQVRRRPCTGAAFRLTVGADETTENTTHTNHGQKLIQVESQVESNRKMRDALVSTGHHVSYREHPGGHNFPSWRATLAESLTALLALPINVS